MAAISMIFAGKTKLPDALDSVTLNLTANLLGLGNATTPAGMDAARRMAAAGGMSDALCLFLVINSSSVQLLPTTVIALRAAAGSAAPDGILWAFVHMISTFGTFAVAAVALFFSFELLFEIGIIGGIIGAVGSVAVVILMGSYPYVLTYSVIGLGAMAAVMFIKTLIVMKRGY